MTPSVAVGFDLVPEPLTPPGGALPPPSPLGPGLHADQQITDSPSQPLPRPLTPRRQPRPGQLTPAWRTIVVTTWVGVFVAYMAVWKASEEIGIATWWLGPRSGPQPILIRLVPFIVAAVFAVLASYNVRRMPVIGLLGSIVLAGIAVPDLSRSTGLAITEFAIAAAALLVSAASFTGTYRAPRTDHAG
jgi:hypothetical protein